ncbi:MAG: alpha/beta hydrolase [Pseudomonadota bacterium]
MILILCLAILLVAPYLAEQLRKPMSDDIRQQAPGHFAQLSQGLTHYDWIGPLRGPIIVCVHGLTTPSFVWRGLAKGLSAMGYRVLIYDLFGRGYSDRVDGIQDAEFFNRQLEDLLADQKVGADITLVGYSMGGAIATSFAARFPERIRHLVLIAPAGMVADLGRLASFVAKTPVIGDWLMMALYPFQFRRGVTSEKDLASSVPDIADLQLAELGKRGFVAAVLSSLRGMLGQSLESEHRALHRAGIPLLAVWGRQDDIIPISAMGTLATWSRSARQEVIEDAGHGLTYTHTDEVLAAMRKGLATGPMG